MNFIHDGYLVITHHLYRHIVVIMVIIIIKPKDKTTSLKPKSCNIIDNSSSNVQPPQPQPPQSPQPQPPQSPQPKKISQSKIYLHEWNEKGNVLPPCINEGCTKPVAIRH